MNRETQEETNRITRQGQYFSTMNSLATIYGDEGRSKIESYFRTFECMTAGWDEYTKATLLASKLQNQARLLYDSLSKNEQVSFERVKEVIMSGGANANSLRAKAQSQLTRGLQQSEGESFLNFGKRLLRVTRDSLLPETPESTVQDQASWHLMTYIRDPTIRGLISSDRLDMDFHKLLDKTVSLMEANAACNQRHDGPRQVRRFENNRHSLIPPYQPPKYNTVPSGREIPSYTRKEPYNYQSSKNPRATGANSQPIQNGARPTHWTIGKTSQVNTTQIGESNSNSNGSVENVLRQKARDQDMNRDEYTRCGAIVGTSLVNDPICLVPLRTPAKRGLTHAIIDHT